MGKYEPLGAFLRKQRASRVTLTFADIERIVGAKLPSSKRYPAWWSNNPWNNVMTKVWLEAGFVTEQVDVEARKLVFRRAAQAPDTEGPAKSGPSPRRPAVSKRHPRFGAMKGLIKIAPGTDLTAPADPDWGKVWD